MKLSARVKVIKPSVTLAVTARAQALRSQGIDLVNFAAGEPDFDTPEHIKQAAVQALRKGMTKYTDVRGIEPLREAVVEKYRHDYGLLYNKDEVLVSCGGKHALYNVFQAILDEGDEVIIPAPYWVSYLDMALLCGAVPRIVPTREENGFRISPEELQAVLTPRTRAFILNSPSNPTGAAYGRDDLAALSQVLEQSECLIISDDVYEKIVYDDFLFHSIVAINPKLRDRTILINSVSKTYAMTGWRIGFAVGPAPVISAAAKIQSQSTSNPTSIAQAAALEALRSPQDQVGEMVREFQKRRDVIVKRLNAMKGIRCFNPQGAFYVFPNFRPLLGKKGKGKRIDSASELAEFFLEEAQVATVPGEDFGSPENIRFTYASSLEDIEKGCDRIEAAIKKLV
ncbi:MAG: pyridoxal phosphate-dependent aminotransferase [Deltaproteobacteria bacterium]|nr:pyridoxal phosphate-dependent aminotransferase [Deltaproteobacteria bacterium]